MLGQILRDLCAQWRQTAQQVSFSATRKNLLHVGCGAYHPLKLPRDLFPETDWKEIPVDIDPVIHLDVVASITATPMISDASCDGVFSSHNLEHVYAHEVPIALSALSKSISVLKRC